MLNCPRLAQIFYHDVVHVIKDLVFTDHSQMKVYAFITGVN